MKLIRTAAMVILSFLIILPIVFDVNAEQNVESSEETTVSSEDTVVPVEETTPEEHTTVPEDNTNCCHRGVWLHRSNFRAQREALPARWMK